jgi:hypothetical protein
MKIKTILICFFCLVSASFSHAQGVSFNYLIPFDGEFAAPVSPLSVRGLGFDLGFIGFETGVTVYNIPGLPVDGLPFETDKSIVGHQYALLVPAQLSFALPIGQGQFKLLSGAFVIQHLFSKVNARNLDRAIADYEGWVVANGDYDISQNPGLGFMSGFEVSIPVSRQFSMNFGVQYLRGSNSSPITGSYVGADDSGSIQSVDFDFADAETRLEGLEISIGASF